MIELLIILFSCGLNGVNFDAQVPNRYEFRVQPFSILLYPELTVHTYESTQTVHEKIIAMWQKIED